MATRVTDGARRERHEKRETTRKARENGLSRSSDFFSSRAAALVSCVSRLRRSRARALLSLNLKKTRDCSQSTQGQVKSSVLRKIFFVSVIVKYTKKNLDITKPRHSNKFCQSLGLSLHRGSTVVECSPSPSPSPTGM